MDEQKVESPVEEALTTAPQAQPVAPAPGSIWSSMEAMKIAYGMAKTLSTSSLTPQNYRGNPADCLIALDMANRTGFSPLHVMQNLYIIQGKPSWSGQFCAAAINACGKFGPLEYVELLEEDGKTLRGYYAQAVRLATGKLCVASPVTWEMVKKEGWDKKSGSKWLSMPDLMFHYRAAAFFVREFCPEVLCGLQTAEEVQDVKGYEKPKQTEVITVD